MDRLHPAPRSIDHEQIRSFFANRPWIRRILDEGQWEALRHRHWDQMTEAQIAYLIPFIEGWLCSRSEPVVVTYPKGEQS